jgi:hypothetical protein
VKSCPKDFAPLNLRLNRYAKHPGQKNSEKAREIWAEGQKAARLLTSERRLLSTIAKLAGKSRTGDSEIISALG